MIDRAVDELRQAVLLPDPRVREAAFIALAQLSRTEATTRGYEMFRELGGKTDGTAARLLFHFTGQSEPTIQQLDTLTANDTFLGMLIAEAFGERGGTVVPELITALRRLCSEEQPSGTWMEHESRKYYIIHALQRIGPPAIKAIPDLVRCLEDRNAYRDTRWIAEQAIKAIKKGIPSKE